MPVEQDALQRQYAALSAMPSVTVTYSQRGPVELVQGETGLSIDTIIDSLKEGETAAEVLRLFGDILLAAGNETLIVSSRLNGPAWDSISFDQYIDGRPVVHGGLHLNLAHGTSQVTGLAAHFLPDRDLPREPVLSSAAAAALAQKYLEGSDWARVGTVRVSNHVSLAYYGVLPDSTQGELVWALNVSYQDNRHRRSHREVIWIDAIDGTYVNAEPIGSDDDFSGNDATGDADPSFACADVPDSQEAPNDEAGCGLLAVPELRAVREDCRGKYRIVWSLVSGATTYHGQSVPAGYPWGLAQTVADGYCSASVLVVTEPTDVRVRACNGCGCSEWAYGPTLQGDSSCSEPQLDRD